MSDRDLLSAQSHLDLEECIRQRAHEIWISRGHHDSANTSIEDWLQAEREVLGDSAPLRAQSRGTVGGDAQAPDSGQMEELGEA